MKAVQIVKPGELRIIDIEKPVIQGKNNVLIKMTASGICGSDMGIYHGTNAAATYPRVVGHEIVGMVADVGADVAGLKKGDHVIVNQVVSCGQCYACRKGRGNVCRNLVVRGVHENGGYQEYLTVPEADCYKIPEGLSDVDAVMIEPTTIAIQCCARAELSQEDTLLILGCGALGSTILKIAKMSGAKIIVADVVEEKLEEARQNGADYTIHLKKESIKKKIDSYTGGYGPTVSVDAVCNQDSLLTLLELTGNAGRVITMGFSVAPTEINQFLITSKELDVRGSRLQNRKFPEAIRLIEEGKLDLSGAVSHTFHFLKAQEAFDFMDTRDSAIRKVVLTFNK